MSLGAAWGRSGFVTLVCTDKGRHRRTVLAEVMGDGEMPRGIMAPRPNDLDHLDDSVQWLNCPRCGRRPRLDLRRLVAGLHDELEKHRGDPRTNPHRYGEVDISALPF